MGYFLVAAVISAIFFFFILYVEPIGESYFVRARKPAIGLAPREYRVGKLTFRGHFVGPVPMPREYRAGVIMFRIVAGMIALFVPFLMLWAISGLVHPWNSLTAKVSDIVFSPQSRSALLGVIFGAVFVVWLARLYAIDGRNLVGAKTEPGKEGSSSLPRGLVFEGYFLLLLFLVGSLDIFGPFLDRITNVELPGGAKLSLSDVSAAVANSPLLTATIPAASPTRRQVSSGLGFLASFDELIARDNSYLDQMEPQDSQPHKKITPAPAEVVTFAREMIAPLAKCHAAINQQSGAKALMIDAFHSLEGPVHALQIAVAQNEQSPALALLIERLAKAYSSAAMAAVQRAYFDNVAFDQEARLALRENNIDELNGSRDALQLASACRPLLSQVCPDQDFTPNDRLPAFCEAPASPRDSSVGAQFEKQFRLLLTTALKLDPFAAQRPYFAIIDASIASVTGEKKAAIMKLDHWAPKSSDRGQTYVWYHLRALSTLSALTEDWLRSDAEAATNPLAQSFSLDVLHDVIAELSDSQFVKNSWSAFHGDTDLKPTLDFETSANNSERCDLPRQATDSKNKVRLIYTLLTSMSLYVDHAMEQADFATSASASLVEDQLKELNIIDFGCLDFLYSDTVDRRRVVDNFRADILRLNARWILIGLSGSQSVRSDADVQSILKSAFSAVTRGERILQKAKLDASEARATAPRFLDKIEPANEIETFRELEALRVAIQQRLKH